MAGLKGRMDACISLFPTHPLSPPPPSLSLHISSLFFSLLLAGEDKPGALVSAGGSVAGFKGRLYAHFRL